MKKRASQLALLLLLSACATREIRDPSEAMRPTVAPAGLTDDMDRESLLKGLRDQIALFTKRSNVNLRFGARSVGSKDYVLALQNFLTLVEQQPDPTQWMNFLRANFEFYEIFGSKEWGEVFMTSYFDPVIKGSTVKTKEFSQALYAAPDDMVVIRMNKFIERFPALEVIRDKLSEQKSGGGILRGRYSKGSPIGAAGEILPYFDREEIDVKGALKNRKLELCFVDPVDAFVLQIQGSGTVQLEDGSEMKVGYASQNGFPYVPVGKFLKHIIPIEEMSLARIENALHAMPAVDKQNYMNKNPSYVFFQRIYSQAITTVGTEVVPGRTIATDPRYFSKGTLAFLQFDKPNFSAPDQAQPTSWTKSQRLVFDQDTGGAIRGPARLDLYWGKGAEAKQSAGVMKNWGRLMYLAPKETYLNQLRMAVTTTP